MLVEPLSFEWQWDGLASHLFRDSFWPNHIPIHAELARSRGVLAPTKAPLAPCSEPFFVPRTTGLAVSLRVI